MKLLNFTDIVLLLKVSQNLIHDHLKFQGSFLFCGSSQIFKKIVPLPLELFNSQNCHTFIETFQSFTKIISRT
jgi:hypothetical protein